METESKNPRGITGSPTPERFKVHSLNAEYGTVPGPPEGI